MASNQQALLMYGAAGAYQIANSLRFRSSASAYLNRTPGSASNRQTWTWSGWVKRGILSAQEALFGCMPVSGSDTTYFEIQFNSSDQLNIAGWATNFLVTSQVFRDPSAWYHVVLSVDTTQATAANRLRLYINGTQVTAFGTANYPAQNTSLGVNQNIQHSIASEQPYNATRNFDGYMADINFIDGQALSPTAFGQYSSTTGVWISASYTGTYGTNGFRLNFSNGTSTTTLGYDSSGNSNNWTTNNISLTAGSTYDWMIDSPTSFAGSSYGVGNYAVGNPLTATGGTLTNANLTYTGPSTGGHGFGSFGVSSGKWYWEATVISDSSEIIGIQSSFTNNFNDIKGYSNSDGKYYSGGTGATYGATFTTNDVIGVAFDLDSGTLTFYKNGVSQGQAASGFIGAWYPAFRCYGTSSVLALNFGQRPFAYTPPSGYKSLCTYNLPTPSIVNGGSYMAATTYTGTGATQSIVNAGGFQPDFVWTKARSAAIAGLMYDSVRGATKYLQTNSTGAEGTGADSLTAFVSNGFTAGADTSTTGVNQNGTTYIGWQWKAGGTAVTNTAGSITSQVSANTTAGFSVVTYTGTGANATVGHGLGVAPNMVIVKARSVSTQSWEVYHSALGGANYVLELDRTVAAVSITNYWYNGMTSSVFGVNGSYAGINGNGTTYVAYCFAAIAGYSAFGSYTGNGSTDGPFIYCGFRPRYVLFKRSDSTGNWVAVDTSRNSYNVVGEYLLPNTSDAGANADMLDIVSNGFKFRYSNVTGNASGGTYIYAAFCEVPFNFALGR